MKNLKHTLNPSQVIGLVTAFLSSGTVFAQNEGLGEEEPVWLDPFAVEAKEDAGYISASAGTATRISMDIVNTPLQVQVINEEFMRDTGRSELVDVFDYSSSVDTSPDDAIRNSDIKVRGFKVGFVLRDGFKNYYDAPLEAVDRVEVVKGPNAVFFGQAQPGGVVNYITKRPIFDSAQYEVRAEIGDNNHYKVWADATGPITDWLAYRVIASYRDSESWKTNTSWENEFIFSALTLRPLEKLEIKAIYEYNTGFQQGGVNTALVGNKEYFRDYYANNGRDWGYNVNWENVGLPVYFEEGLSVRYPWSEDNNAESSPPTGWGGINPRWDGTITPELEAFFGGNVPSEFLNWSQPDSSLLPAYQQNVTQPFQYNMIELFSSGTGADYLPGWRILKWFQSGMDRYPNRFTGPVFPRGFNWNANGIGSFHDTEHHIATLEITGEIFPWLNFRYGGNYLEKSFIRVQQFNSDTDMDGFTLFPAQGFSTSLGNAPASGAAVNNFLNSRFTHQLDFTFDFEWGDTTHTFLISGELREDKFTNFDIGRSEYFFDNVLRPTVTRGGSPRRFTPQEGVANWDIFFDQPDPISKWMNLDDDRVDEGTSNFHQEEGISASYKGTFLNEKLYVLTGFRWEQRTDFNWDGEEIGQQKPRGSISATTPMVGFTYEVKPNLTVYASYSESFLPPNRPQRTTPVVFYEGDTNNPTTRSVELDDLGVEKGVGYEGGFKAYGFNEKLTGSISVFHLERQNIIVTDSDLLARLRENYRRFDVDFESQDFSGGNAPRKNSGVEVTEGVELDVNYRIRDNWSVQLSFSYLWKAELENPDQVDFLGNTAVPVGSGGGPYPHPSLFSDEELGSYTIPSSGETITVLRPLTPSEIDEAKNEAALNGGDPVNPYTGEPLVFEPIQHTTLAQVSKLRFSAWTRYEFQEKLEGLVVGFGGNYQSRQRPQQTRDLDYWNPGFWIFDSMISYTIPWRETELTFQLNVNNIFEKRAIDSGSFGINAPRTWKLTATYKF